MKPQGISGILACKGGQGEWLGLGPLSKRLGITYRQLLFEKAAGTFRVECRDGIQHVEVAQAKRAMLERYTRRCSFCHMDYLPTYVRDAQRAGVRACDNATCQAKYATWQSSHQ